MLFVYLFVIALKLNRHYKLIVFAQLTIILCLFHVDMYNFAHRLSLLPIAISLVAPVYEHMAITRSQHKRMAHHNRPTTPAPPSGHTPTRLADCSAPPRR